jgi:hypothetical protein
MLVACRLAGLSALGAHYAGVKWRAMRGEVRQCLGRRSGTAVDSRPLLAQALAGSGRRRYPRPARSDRLARRRPIMESWSSYVTGSNADNVIELRRAGA